MHRLDRVILLHQGGQRIFFVGVRFGTRFLSHSFYVYRRLESLSEGSPGRRCDDRPAFDRTEFKDTPKTEIFRRSCPPFRRFVCVPAFAMTIPGRTSRTPGLHTRIASFPALPDTNNERGVPARLPCSIPVIDKSALGSNSRKAFAHRLQKPPLCPIFAHVPPGPVHTDTACCLPCKAGTIIASAHPPAEPYSRRGEGRLPLPIIYSTTYIRINMTDTWITSVIAPIAVALVSWILGKNSRRIDETSKIVALLQDEINRLTVKVEKLETKLETQDETLERKSMIIQEAFRCRTPSMKCPVLLKQAEMSPFAPSSAPAVGEGLATPVQ